MRRPALAQCTLTLSVLFRVSIHSTAVSLSAS